MTYTSK